MVIHEALIPARLRAATGMCFVVATITIELTAIKTFITFGTLIGIASRRLDQALKTWHCDGGKR